MMWMERILILAMRLYPRPFHARFGEEMEEVFRAGLADARARRQGWRFLLREMLRLPGSLAGVYLWSARVGEGSPAALSAAGGGAQIQPPVPRAGWAETTLAVLPHLMIGSFIVISGVLGMLNEGLWQVANILFLLIFGLLMIGVLVFIFRRGWQRWSASWLVYISGMTLALGWQGLSQLFPSIQENWEYSLIMLFILPVVIAWMIYKAAAADRLGGLLAALPATILIWGIFQEFVPVLQKSLAWTWASVLAVMAAAMILRTGRFRSALAPAVAAPVLCGMVFSYLSVYMGGTLPFSEPGPSLRETARQYLPFLAAVLSFTIGPQLAVSLRGIGRESAAKHGNLASRLVLGGMLLWICSAVLYEPQVTSDLTWKTGVIVGDLRQAGILGGAVLYLTGWALLLFAVIRSGAYWDDLRAGLRMAGLFILLPGVPAVLTFALNEFRYSTSPPWNWVYFAVEFAWAAASLWLLSRES